MPEAPVAGVVDVFSFLGPVSRAGSALARVVEAVGSVAPAPDRSLFKEVDSSPTLPSREPLSEVADWAPQELKIPMVNHAKAMKRIRFTYALQREIDNQKQP
ncbi:MAG: hypothetical protein M3305_11395 [Actinomycetota bacterium]|nr:hypothetical protein [Actinomycetota bacterium]